MTISFFYSVIQTSDVDLLSRIIRLLLSSLISSNTPLCIYLGIVWWKHSVYH
jgi:hypothetical protein